MTLRGTIWSIFLILYSSVNAQTGSVENRSPLFNHLPTRFDDYMVYMNPDSLEKIVYAQKNNPTAYLHGLISLEMSRYNRSDKFGQDLDTIKALAERQGSELGLAMYDYAKGQIFLKTDLKEAAKCGQRMVHYFERRNDTLGMIMGYGYLLKSNISPEYIVWGDMLGAKAYYLKIMELSKNSVDVQTKVQVARIYLTFHQVIMKESSLKKELAVFEEAINLINQNPRYEFWRPLMYIYIGTPLFENKAYSKLLEYNLKAYQLYGDTQSKSRIPDLYNIANAYRLNEKYKEAEQYFLKAIDLYKKTNEDKPGLLSQIYGQLATSQYMQKKYDEAWGYRNTADSLNNLNHKKVKSRELLDIQTKYETEKKELENKKLLTEAAKQRQQNLFWILVAACSLIITGIIFYIYRKIRAKNAELTRLNELIASRNQDLNVANQRMEHFTHALSHNALGYINHILNYTTLGQNLSNNDDSITSVFQRIHRNASRLKSMSENLINYNKNRRTINLENFDLNSILSEAVEDLAFDLSNPDIELKIEDLPQVHANREFVKEVFRNLLGNATKFKKPNTPLSIYIKSSPNEQSDFVELQVQDNGIGIAPEKISEVFKEFVKGNKAADGSGLGLFICRQIIENLGGKIWVRSQQGEGCTFFLTLKKATA